MLLFVSSEAVESNLVKLETSHTYSDPIHPSVSFLWISIPWFYCVKLQYMYFTVCELVL